MLIASGIFILILGMLMLINLLLTLKYCTEVVYGTVVTIEKSCDDPGFTFYPAFEYIVNGITYVKKSHFGYNASQFHIGQTVKIYYNPINPNHFHEEIPYIYNILLRLLMIVFGVILIAISIKIK